jgi:hypothetical protein
MLQNYPILGRFVSKLLCEFIPASIASVVGAVVLSHYVGTTASKPPSAVADPATAEMLQMARDEHARIIVYLEKNGEALTLADVAAEKEKSWIKGAEEAALFAGQSAKLSETKTSALATPAADKSAKKVSASRLAHKPERAAAVGEPLQLSNVANVTTAQTPPVASAAKPTAPTARQGGNFIVTTWREATATVERIPKWVHSVVGRLSDNIPPLSLPRLPLHII